MNTIEVGKEYKTKNGEIVKIIYRKNSILFPFVGIVNENNTVNYDENGESFSHDFDIKFPKPPRQKYWVTIYKYNDGYIQTGAVHLTKQEAEKASKCLPNVAKIISFTL